MENENKRIVEIGGVKVEVDMKTAKVVDSYKVGDAVKVLMKGGYSSDYIVSPGVILSFTEFQNLPAIEILCVKNQYGDVNISIVTLTEKTTDIEIAPFHEYEIVFSRADVLGKIQKKIEIKQEELRVLETKKKAFVDHFGKAFANELVD